MLYIYHKFNNNPSKQRTYFFHVKKNFFSSPNYIILTFKHIFKVFCFSRLWVDILLKTMIYYKIKINSLLLHSDWSILSQNHVTDLKSRPHMRNEDTWSRPKCTRINHRKCTLLFITVIGRFNYGKLIKNTPFDIDLKHV